MGSDIDIENRTKTCFLAALAHANHVRFELKEIIQPRWSDLPGDSDPVRKKIINDLLLESQALIDKMKQHYNNHILV